MPEREKELRGIAEEKTQPLRNLNDESDNQYDIVTESKKKLEKQQKEQKDYSQISKNIMSNKNRKLLKVIEKSIGQKRDVAETLKQKSIQLKKKQ
jgi:hypothetical protein